MISPYRQHRRILVASLVGTAVEFYDFYIYATAAALVFGPLFFPASSEAAQLMLSFLSFGLAFIARPFGAVLFGHYGDRIGRKSTLVVSLLLMGVSTLLIAFLPTYAMAGWIAPLLLCILRFGQGLGLGGEWGGAALLAVENAPPGWRARFGMVPQLGAPVGFLAANGLFLLLGMGLSEADFAAWGWRIPFLASAILVGLGLWVRLKINETPEFAQALEKDPPIPVPIGELIRNHALAAFAGTFAVVACFAIFYLSTAFALAHGTTTLGYDRETFLAVQLAATVFLVLGIIAAGVQADASSSARVLTWGCVATIGMGVMFGPLLGSGSLWLVWIALSFALFVMGFVYGPLGAWLPSLFPARVRYTGASVAFNAGGILGGAVAPVAAQALSEFGGTAIVGLYLTMAGMFSLAGLLLARRYEAR
ncbi:MFS transporter [Nitrosomonas sp.]|uniref:MFS transporter n=1 Tax=Nitrosomonas sp. TaxID=42353 RepID=UPI0025F59B23|nr:MFS transporter [Nitrosomonas sp.]MBS0587139.1 MFS transporter [Pseudomonadota bacterium]MBV6447336.1 Inner membrane metabolite transport protein YhjE [Nitrosomonas sp.]